MKGDRGMCGHLLGVALIGCAMAVLSSSPAHAQGIGSATSASFALWLGRLSEGFALSPAFSVDTRLPAAVVGTVRGAADGLPVAGATVELFLGSTRQQATSTDGSGHYEFFATLQGDYVLRVSKSGYSMATSDLVRFRGSTLTQDFSLAGGPPPGQTLADLVIGATDLTYTPVTSGALTLTAMVHNNGAATATDVRVRFYDASTGSGVNDYARITPDVVIGSLAPGEAKPASVNWTPPSGHQRFYVFADPDGAIAEPTELNNGNLRDLGAAGVGRSAPRVLGVSARYDGLSEPRLIGRFLTGIEGAVNLFGATVTDGDGDAAHVCFDFNGTKVWDVNGSDGWSVSFDTGRLPSGNLPLIVTAYDAAGLASEPWVATLVVDDWPDWMKGRLELGDGPAGFGVEPGYHVFEMGLRGESPGASLFSFVEMISPDVLIVGNKRSTFSLEASLKFSRPLNPGLPWKVTGTMKSSDEVFDRPLQEGEFSLGVSISPDGQTLESITFEFGREVAIANFPEFTSPPLFVSVIRIEVGLSMDVLLRAELEGTLQANLAGYEISLRPQVGAQINGTLRVSDPVKFARLELILSPRLMMGPVLDYTYPPGSLDVSGLFSAEVRGRLVGSLIWGLVRQTLLSFTWGPWDWTYPSSAQGLAVAGTMELEADSAHVPQLFPYPAAATGADGRLGLIWVSDVDPDAGRADPEVYFAERDSEGVWGTGERVTTNDRYETIASLAYLSDGRAVAAWIQSSLGETEVEPTMTLAGILDRQDVWYSVREGTGWSPPAPVVADTLPPFRADGLPVLAPAGTGAMLVWGRSVGDSALAPGSGEIFSARFDGEAWSSPRRVTDDEADDACPAVCAAGGDSVLACWVREDPAGSGAQSLVWSLWNGSDWSALRALRTSGWRVQSPSVARAGDGTSLAAWVEVEKGADSSLVYHLLEATLAAGDSTWSAAREVFADSQFIETPLALVDRRGIAVVTWRGYDGYDGDLQVALRDLATPGSPWTEPRAITADSLTDWMAAAAIDDQNNLHVIELKSDLGAPPQVAASAANLPGGLTLVSRGIARDLGMTDQLNFGYRPMSCDLKLAADAVSVSDPHAVLGDTVQVRCRVDNVGDVRSAVTTVRFYDGDPDSGGVFLPDGAATLGEISPDSSLTVSAQWVAAAGAHTFHAVADPDNAVAEQTESNNRATASIGVHPDLLVDSLVVFNTNPLPGTTDSLTAWVRNAGGAAAAGFSVRFTRGDSLLETAAGLSLGVAGSMAVTVSFTAAAGTDSLAVVVDPDSMLVDPNRANNEASIGLSVLPDLALPADSIAYAEGDSTLSATIVNLGGLGSGAFRVFFFERNPLVDGVVIDSVQVDSLGAFSDCRVSVPWHAPLGTTTVHVTADPAGQVAERDRANNGSYADVVSSALPDLVAVPGSVEVQVAAGPVITLSARVTNAGAAHSLAVGVEFFRGDPDSGGTLIGDRLLAVVPMGETTAVAVNWANPDPVQNPVFVVVDRAAGIPELAEGNNRISQLLGGVVEVPPVPALPVRLALHPARPNPFSRRTAIHFDLPVGGNVRLDIFDVAGRRVSTLVNGSLAAGSHVSEWDGRGGATTLSAGVYFARLQAPGGTLRRKLVRLD